MCIRKYECMHCIILYFVATCKRPFGPLLLNKMKAKNNTQYHIKSQQTEGKLRRKHVTPLFVNVSILQPMMHVLTHTEVELITVYDFSELNIMWRKQHCRSNRQLCCLLLRQCCRFGQQCRSNVRLCRSNIRLCRKDEISTQTSFDIVAFFATKSNVVSTLLLVWTGL